MTLKTIFIPRHHLVGLFRLRFSAFVGSSARASAALKFYSTIQRWKRNLAACGARTHFHTPSSKTDAFSYTTPCWQTWCWVVGGGIIAFFCLTTTATKMAPLNNRGTRTQQHRCVPRAHTSQLRRAQPKTTKKKVVRYALRHWAHKASWPFASRVTLIMLSFFVRRDAALFLSFICKSVSENNRP